jgi:predicted DNA-binding WGR domain protein
VLYEISIALQACDPAANRHRSWRVEAGRDLFGQWWARVCFGRIGCRGRTMRHEFGSEAEARAFVRRGLRRRRGSIKRCGVAYRLIEASSAAAPLLAITGIAAQGAG